MNQLADLPGRAAERGQTSGTALETLRDLIVQGELAPGSRLNERLLCERLGVSRTPLREAIKALASEGLVELHPNRGASVAPVTVARVREIFQVMGALESLAGQLACAAVTEADIAELRALHWQMVAQHQRGDLTGYFRTNQDIHLRIVDLGGNAALSATYRQLNAHVRRARYMANLSAERWAQAVDEHERMMEALAARDAARLQALLAEHLGNKMLSVIAALQAASNDPAALQAASSNPAALQAASPSLSAAVRQGDPL